MKSSENRLSPPCRIGSLLLLAAASSIPSALMGLESGISLSGRKDLILSTETRDQVLQTGEALLDREGDPAADWAEFETPFLFDQPKEIAPETSVVEDEVAPPEPVVYDDASVLQAVAESFRQQVRGSLARGGITFLQLEGGNLVRPGTTFPARLPQSQGQSFQVTITEITPETYVLALGEATVRINYDRSDAGSGRIRFTD